MKGLDNDGKDIPLYMVHPPIEDFISGGQDPLGQEDVLHLPFILTQPQSEGGGSGIGNSEKIQQGRDIHLPAGIPINTLAQIEDHIGTDLLQPVDHGKDFITNGHHKALMAEGSDRLLYRSNLLDDRILSQNIPLLPFLESFKEIV